MRIRAKIFLLIFATSLLIFSIVIAYIINDYRNYSFEDANKQVRNYASNAASLIKTSLENDLSVCYTISQAYNNYAGIPKKSIEKIRRNTLSSVLESNSEYLSIWTTWELRFLDKNYTLDYGRQRVSAVKASGIIVFYSDTIELQGDNMRSLYYKSKQSKLDILIDPYYFKYSRDNTLDSILVTSIATPIIVNKEFAGMVGVDISINRYEYLIKEFQSYNMGNIFLLSNKGRIISSNLGDKIKLDTISALYPEILKHNFKQNIKSKESFSFTFVDSTQTKFLAAFAPIEVGNAENTWTVCFIAPVTALQNKAETYFTDSIFVGFMGILIMSIISFIVASRMSIPVKKATRTLDRIARGELDIPKRKQTKSKDELAYMNVLISKLVNRLKTTADFVKKIGEGNLTEKYEVLSKNDELGKAFVDMQRNLKIGKEQEELRQIERQKLSWTQEGLTELSEVLRKGNTDFEEYLLSILSYILKYIKAEQGAIFLLNTLDKEHPFLQLRSAYAYDKKKALEAQIEIGESLVGRCFQEEETIYMTNIPEGYTFVSSGLGEHQPRCLFLMPLIFEKEAFGVVELAAFREFEDYEIDFLKVIGERIASSISVMEKNFQTQKVLERYEYQSAELKNIENTLAANTKELAEAQKIATEKELESAGIIGAISDLVSITWLSIKGEILDVKDKHLSVLGHSKDELIEQKKIAIASMKDNKTDEFLNLWRNLEKGIEGKLETSYVINKKTINVTEIFYPVKNAKGEITKIINITLDLSKSIKHT